jgi:hypothetical protein
MLATKELHKQHQQHSQKHFNLNAKILATFLESVEGEETLLLQRLRDRESVGTRESRNESVPACAAEEGFPTTDNEDRLSSVEVPLEIYGEF